MAKQNFTADGVKAKTAELYALSDAALQAEVASMRADFRSWLSNNFVFTTDQATYLKAIDSRFLSDAGAATAAAAGSRLPIQLQVPVPPGGYSSKFIVISGGGLNPRYDSLAGYSVSGTLQFTIGYNI
ncbi:hypothetical protein MTO98_09590 [Mucilaginibacter sp. SMC90]|uniref:hypothetical protein n=1 Tax=Mucilaginibacter sp. SMC90 TaxID=2929803 RepID=UPI001FB32317|nr:hypothetical protein [Mucilaginibacter sp. SMC90]UOE51330.1 hypothetical protein MTO98_09590 [Mucilaginibacter sp. SMC90]